MVAFLYFVLPKILGLKETWNRLGQGDVWWLVVAAFLELLSFGCYIALFRAVFVREKPEPGGRRQGSAGARATRSRWPVSPQPGCSQPPAPAGSR